MKANEVVDSIEARFQAQRVQLSPLSRSHYRAVLNWLKRPREKPGATRLQQVQG